MFENEYVMDHKRYEKWTVPKFWCVPLFYVWMVVFFISIFGIWYFTKNNVSKRWVSLAALMAFVSIYRAIPRRWMAQNKQYRVTAQQYFNEKPWTCRIVISNNYIEQYLNGKLDNTIGWDQIKKYIEGKSHILLGTGNGREGIMLDKDSFTKGKAEDLKIYVRNQHPTIIFEKEVPAYDK